MSINNTQVVLGDGAFNRREDGTMRIGSFSDYNSILQNMRVPSIPRVEPESIVKNQEDLAASNVSSNLENYNSDSSIEANSRSNIPLEDISLTFNSKDEFEQIGSEKDIHSLDVEKAISSMKKDELLKQYQYFVGDSGFTDFPELRGSVTVK